MKRSATRSSLHCFEPLNSILKKYLLEDFIQFVRGPEGRFLGDGREVMLARAPGRLDLMGGIADYSGALVLQYPISLAAYVALAKSEERTLELISIVDHGATSKRRYEINLEELLAWDYQSAREWFRADGTRHWAAYVAGAFLVLHRELDITFDSGARIPHSFRGAGGQRRQFFCCA